MSSAKEWAEAVARATPTSELLEAKDYLERQVALREANRPPPRQYARIDTPTPVGRTHLVIGDSHSQPEIPNHRYEWLGRMVRDLQPDTVIDIGDWWSMDSLCSYDKGKHGFEARRLRLDFEAGIDAMARFRAEYGSWSGELHRCLGNHENRISRLLDYEPLMRGVIGLEDLASQEFGWQEHPFLEEVLLDGVTYCHYWQHKGRATTGVVPAKMLADKAKKSVVTGHNHLYSYYGEPRSGVYCASAGGFFTHWMDWAGPDNSAWDKGILLLRGVRDGRFDPQWYSMGEIQSRWG